ncbi:MAG: LysM peptidoglycan-binding domain-containing protein [Desulfobacterales bacterium]|nr:LysM peptidoglycan-binding domain-containing protein [Desulfobacterales bacterium]
MRRKYWLAILLIAFGVWFVDSGVCVPVGAQPLTHTVVKGDTLWDICDQYYGDEELWPKLWQMNPFITNPHLLKPGDVIKLLENVPVKKSPAIESETASPGKPPAEFVYGETGIDVSGFTNAASIGFLSRKEVEPWGYVVSSGEERVVLSEGDSVYVAMKKECDIKPGDEFTIYKASPVVKHPLTGKKLGYVISFLGRVGIKEKVKDIKEEDVKKKVISQEQNLYSAEIVESYMAIPIGSPILSYKPLSPCMQPMPMESELTTNIVAIKDMREVIGQFSVVYLDQGYNHGIRRGNLFEIVEKKQAKTPQKITLPDMIMGHVVIVEARPDTATGVVVTVKEEFFNGVFVNRIDWPDAKIVLSMVPECPLE